MTGWVLGLGFESFTFHIPQQSLDMAEGDRNKKQLARKSEELPSTLDTASVPGQQMDAK